MPDRLDSQPEHDSVIYGNPINDTTVYSILDTDDDTLLGTKTAMEILRESQKP